MPALGESLERGGEEREQARRELADFIAKTAFIRDWGVDRGGIKQALAAVPEPKRPQFIDELTAIAAEVGWEEVQELLRGELTLDHEVRRAVGVDPDVKLYDQVVRRPDAVTHIEDFIAGEGTPIHYWIPRKVDIRRYVRVAELAHVQSNRTGPIRILDVGGGSGFLAKLIADEAYEQGLEVEVVVVDPDERAVTEAARAFTDTPNVRFEVGTARDAFRRYSPELSQSDRDAFDALEREQETFIARCYEELPSIKATLAALEGVDNGEALLQSPFGDTAALLLRKAGIDPQETRDIESVRNAIARHYDQRFEFFRKTIAGIRDRQEHLLMLRTRDLREAKFDVVLNSWMPSGIDFTRELRSIGAPTIIYALESGGATGMTDYRESPEGIERERSYGTGSAYRDVASWNGIAINKFYRGDDGQVKYLTSFSPHGQRSEIQCRKGVSIGPEDIRVSPIPDEEKYPWERSLEELAGRGEIERIDESFD